MNEPAILDASLVLAFLQGEPINDDGKAAIRPGAKITAINLCEVYGKLIDRGMDAATARDVVGKMRLDVEPVDEDLAYRAAFFRTIMPKHISLADRTCLALGEARSLPVYTCDRDWLKLAAVTTVKLAR